MFHLTGTARRFLVTGIVLLASIAARAEKFDAAHWKSQVEMDGGRAGARMPGEYEIWMKGDRMRMKAEAAGVSMNMLRQGDYMYTWSEGQTSGMKMNVAASQRSQRSNSDYVNRVDEYRTKGKKLGTETLDGHPCEIWDYTDQYGNHGKYWLAGDLKFFPVKAVIESPGSTVTYHNTDIQIPAAISDDMMALPKGVDFQDMSEMMRGERPK
jgi:hypothetical protein